MRDHGSPAISLGQVVSLDGFSHGSDLVYLEEQAVACFAIDGSLDTLGVCDREIVTNDLQIQKKEKQKLT